MPEDPAGVLLGLCVGIGLAAATGFRVFVPLLVLNIAAMNEALPIELAGTNFEWVGSPICTVIFGAATAVEIAGYYIPWVDNLLDTITTPAAVIAGSVAVASLLGDTDPALKWTMAMALKWTMAIIAGGGAAGSIQLLTVGTRAASTATTGGVGNPVVSTAEAGGSVLVAILAIVIPIVVAIGTILFIAWLGGKFFRRRRIATAEVPVS